MGKKGIGECCSRKSKKEYKVGGSRSRPAKKFWSKSKGMRIQIAMPTSCAVRAMQGNRAIGKASKRKSGKKNKLSEWTSEKLQKNLGRLSNPQRLETDHCGRATTNSCNKASRQSIRTERMWECVSHMLKLANIWIP